jgi:hypothetical protein
MGLGDDARAGAAAGATATAVVNTLVAAGRRTRRLGRRGPGAGRRGRAGALVGLVPYGFGAAFGALYEVARKAVPVRTPPVVAGAAMGLGVWLVGERGWVPALRVLPAPEQGRVSRPSSRMLAHMLYGATVGGLLRRR